MTIRFGKWLGYTGEPCVNCGRYRVEKYSDGHQVCEKCSYDQDHKRYVTEEEKYEEEDEK